MFEKTNVTLETCDRALAITFSQMPSFKGERPFKPARLNFLRNHVKDGTFASPTWAVVVDKTTNKRYRANGHHSSTVLAELTEAEWQSYFPKGLMATVEEYTSDDLVKDAFLIFDLFDNPISVRGNVDVMNLHRVQYEDLKDVTSQVLLNLMTGVALYEKSQSRSEEWLWKGIFLSTRDRGLYLDNEENRKFVLWAAPFATTMHGRLLKKPGVVAEMVTDWRMDLKMADDFWQLVFNESHPDPDHETRELSREYKKWEARPKKVSQDDYRKEAAKQWRRFRKVQSTTALKLNPDDLSMGGPTEATV